MDISRTSLCLPFNDIDTREEVERPEARENDWCSAGDNDKTPGRVVAIDRIVAAKAMRVLLLATILVSSLVSTNVTI